ncbi:MAG: hypothetical protein A2Z34_11450 [Planctomycetes bacterium RBG_16_59_8]|nr:MAG: hypothetical protein A2Z34_11450 [Planctomycetes bacterium RBG_16_59_8]
MRPAIVLLALLVGCSTPPPASSGWRDASKESRDTLRVKMIREDAAHYEQYVTALILFGDRDPRSWLLGEQKLAELDRFYREREEGELIRSTMELAAKTRGGDRDAAEKARAELSRRGRILHLLRDFDLKSSKTGAPEPVDFRRWDESLDDILRIAVNNDAIELLTDTLLRRFLDSRYEIQYYYIRNVLLKIGKPAIDPVLYYIRELQERVPAESVSSRYDRALTQCLIVLSMSGPSQRQILVECGRSPKPAVRAALARALGEVRDPADLDLLDLLLISDGSWEVRARAASAIGEITTDRSGLLLIRSLKSEKDPIVQISVVKALGVLKEEKGIPDLLRLLERTGEERVRETIFWSLKILTGHDRRSVEWWREWWKTQGVAPGK